MRKPLLAAAVFLMGSAAAVAQLQPLNAMTGQWEVTETTSINVALPPELQARMSQMPPQVRAQLESQFGGAPQTRTFKSCIKQPDLTRMPFESPNQECQWTVLTSTSSEMNVRGACRSKDNNGGPETANVTIHITLANAQTATGDGQIAMSGGRTGTMNGTYRFAGKWLGATCEQ